MTIRSFPSRLTRLSRFPVPWPSEGGAMKTDTEVQLMLRTRTKV